MYDLIVIGGGPAGTAAAISAARAGRQLGRASFSVLLLERGSFPRQKVCGEFVSGEALDSLQGLLAPHTALLERAPRIARARFYPPNEPAISVEIAPAAASLSRWELDASLWQAAIAAGVDCRHGVEVERVQTQGEQSVVNTADGMIRGRAVIDASGRWSRLNAGGTLRQSTGHSRPCCIGLKAHFVCTASRCGPDSEPGERLPRTDLYFFRGGYCGVQPAFGGRLNVCAMVASSLAVRLDDVFRLHPVLWQRSRAWAQATEQVATAPLLFRRPRPCRENVFCAGDAAGFIDPFAGDGISLAVRSSFLAVEALTPFWQGKSPLPQALSRYSHDYKKAFARAFSMASLMRIGSNAPNWLQTWLWRGLRLPFVAELMVRNTR